MAGSRLGEEGTDPAMVATERTLPAELYWHAVREVVPVPEVRRALEAAGAWYRTRGSDRGLVGAAAAVAWPGHRPTWELTAYRTPDRVGRPREVDPDSVRAVAKRFPSLFLSHDPRTRRLLVAPHSACPVLFGLRSTERAPLPAARAGVRSEPADRWVVFRTNQASGDHLTDRSGAEVRPYLSARIRATVAARPEVRPGGHVLLRVTDLEGREMRCLAFEPTKTLPRVAATLLPGDRVVLWGSRGRDPSFRLEGIRLVRLVPRLTRPRPPECPTCHRGTRSRGTGRGFRCPVCHSRLPPEAATPQPRPPRYPRGVYHPTPSARRHLAPRGPEGADEIPSESF